MNRACRLVSEGCAIQFQFYFNSFGGGEGGGVKGRGKSLRAYSVGPAPPCGSSGGRQSGQGGGGSPVCAPAETGNTPTGKRNTPTRRAIPILGPVKSWEEGGERSERGAGGGGVMKQGTKNNNLGASTGGRLVVARKLSFQGCATRNCKTEGSNLGVGAFGLCGARRSLRSADDVVDQKRANRRISLWCSSKIKKGGGGAYE